MKSRVGSRSFYYVGIGCASHTKFQVVSVVIFATEFTVHPEKNPQGNFKLNIGGIADSSASHMDDEDENTEQWPAGAISMKEKNTEEIKNGMKIIKRVKIFKMQDGTTQKKETTEMVKLK